MLLGKSATDRLEDVFDTIAKVAPAGTQGLVRTQIEKATRYNEFSKAGLASFSSTVSLRNVKNQGDADERMMRRVIIVLGSMRHDPSAYKADRVQAMGPFVVLREFRKLTEDFAMHATQEGGDNQLLNTKLSMLRDHPRRFMREHKFFLFGSSENRGLINALPFKFFYNYKTDDFRIQSPKVLSFGVSGGLTVVAVSVPAVVWDEVPGRGTTKLNGSFAGMKPTELAGADLMISTQFSGCSMCVKQTNGRTYASHIMPSGADVQDADGTMAGPKRTIGDGALLARQLIQTGNFGAPAGGNGQLLVYGAGLSNVTGHAAGYTYVSGQQGMFVLGVRRAGNWRIYSQQPRAGVTVVERIL